MPFINLLPRAGQSGYATGSVNGADWRIPFLRNIEVTQRLLDALTTAGYSYATVASSDLPFVFDASASTVNPNPVAAPGAQPGDLVTVVRNGHEVAVPASGLGGGVSPSDLAAAVGAAVPGAVAAAVPGAVAAAVPSATASALTAAGYSSNPQTTLATAKGGAFNPARPAIDARNDYFTAENDRASLQESINRASDSGRTLALSGPATAAYDATIVLPNNTKIEGASKQIQPSAALTAAGGYLAAMGSSNNAAGYPMGYSNNLYLQQPYASDGAGTHVDHTKTLDGLLVSDTSNYVHFGMRLRGFRYGEVFDNPNNYIQSHIGGSISGNWLANILWKSSTNSGERMVWTGMSLSDCRNPVQSGTSIYIDPTSSDQDFYLAFCSLSYSDKDLFNPHSQVTFFGNHQESNNNIPRVTSVYTGGRTSPMTTWFGGSQGSGPNLSWTNKSPYSVRLVWACGPAAMHDVTSSRAGHAMFGTTSTGAFRTVNVTELLRDCGKSFQHNANFVGIFLDCGWIQHNATLGSGTAPLGRGMPPTLSYTHGNCLYVPPANTLTGLTLTSAGTNFVSDQTRALNLFGNSRFLDRSTASTELAQATYLLHTVMPGQNLHVEMSAHIDGYVDGFANLNVVFYADDAGTIPIANFGGAPGIELEGIRTDTGVSSTGATITIPDPVNEPWVGLYTPGTMQSGAVQVGDDLSGAGIVGRVFVGASAGNGQWYVDMAPAYGTRAAPVAVAATTIYHWRLVKAKFPIPEGCRKVKISEQVRAISGRTNIQGKFWIGRTLMHLS